MDLNIFNDKSASINHDLDELVSNYGDVFVKPEDDQSSDDGNSISGFSDNENEIEDALPKPGTSRGSKGRRKYAPMKSLPPALANLIGMAHIKMASGEFDLAFKVCKEVIDIDPEVAEPYAIISQIYEEKGELLKSLQCGIFGLKYNRNNVPLWLHYAELAQRLGRLKDAVACYSTVVLYEKNVEVYLKKIKLLEEMKEKFKVAATCMQIVKISKDGKLVFEIAKKGAKIFHELPDIPRALEIMEIAFKNHPESATMEDVNLITELYNFTKKFDKSLEVISKYCDVQIEAEEDIVRDETTQEIDTSCFRVLSCQLTSAIPIEILIKLIIALINLQAFHISDTLIDDLKHPEILEANGDLVFEVAETLMQMKQHSSALQLLKLLVKTQNFNMAAVWLAYADCLKVLNRVEEATSAYLVVMEKAPHLSEPRIVVSQLLNEMGRSDEALSALNVDPEAAALDPELLYQRYNLLKGNSARREEQMAIGRIILSRHCARIRNLAEVKALVSFKGVRRRQMALEKLERSDDEEMDMDPPNIVHAKPSINSVKADWEIFMNLIEMAFENKQFALLQRLVYSALGSNVLCHQPEQDKKICYLSAFASFHNNDIFHGYSFIRDLLLKDIHNRRLWHFFNLYMLKTGDLRHHKFLVRLIQKYPNLNVLSTLYAHCTFLSSSYKAALSEYIAIMKHEPNPVVALMCCLCFVHILAQKNKTVNGLCQEALGYFSEYKRLRGSIYAQEIYYNTGRLMHQLNFLPGAVFNYKRVFQTAAVSDRYDLKREAAFNLCLIYKQSKQFDLARHYMKKYIVFD